MEARPYQANDREACLALLRQRDAGREPAFCEYLDQAPADFFVLEHAGEFLGCGGITHSSGSADELVWGMIDPKWERRGLGRYLLLFRARLCRAELLQVEVDPAYAAFYEKAGFRRGEHRAGRVHLQKKMAVCP